MITFGKGRTMQGSEDSLKMWLDGCYRRWKKAYRWPLLLVMTIVWLPAAAQFYLQYQYYIKSVPDMALIQLASWLRSNGPMLGVLIGMIAATVASSFLKFEPEVLITSTRMSTFSALRSAIRVQTFHLLIWLMLIPSISVHVIGTIGVVLRFNAEAIIIPRLLPGLLMHGLFWLACCWIMCELFQFINLRYYSKPILQRIIYLVISTAIYIGFIWFLPMYLARFMFEPIWLFYGLIMLVAYGIPFGLSIYMMLATRKPTQTMLEGF